MFSIRKLRAADAAAYRAIRLESLQLHPDYFGASAEEEGAEPISLFRERLSNGSTFGAFDDGQLIGVAGFVQHYGAKRQHKGSLVGMYVRASGRGHGAGGALVDAVIGHARGLVETLQLCVASSNAPAIGLYESRGFMRYAIEPRALKTGDTYVDEFLMERRV